MAASNIVTFTKLVRLVQTHDPKFRVIAKRNSKLHRFVGWCLRFPWIRGAEINSEYMTDYWTTVGHTAAHPGTATSKYQDWPSVPHEGFHGVQALRNTATGMAMVYLLGTPVYGIVGALLTLLLLPLFILVIPWPWLFLPLGLGILLSCPVPFGYWRAKWELEAYSISLATHYWRYGTVRDDYLEEVVDIFRGPAYFYMYPYRHSMLMKLHNIRKSAITGMIFKDKSIGIYARRLFFTLQILGHSKVSYRS